MIAVRSGDNLPISAFFTRDWEPVAPSDTPTVTIERRNISTGVWDIPVSAQSVTVRSSGLCHYTYATTSGHYEYTVYMDSVDTTLDQNRIVLDTFVSGGAYDDINNSYDDIQKILGLVHENIYIDNTSYDSYGNMTSARVRIYSDASSVGTSSNVIGTYTITVATTALGKFTSWEMVSS